MKQGFVLPYGDARTAATAAVAAEEAGWDGFFVWEPVWGIDAWVALTAAAMVTETIRLGTMLTPLSRMRPWKIASETATLDNLSGGRVILAVGLGAIDSGFENFGEETDLKTRAELLDESLDIITGLWDGHPFAYEGTHYSMNTEGLLTPPPPGPVQQPIPIWVVGAWNRPRSMARALKYEGIIPNVIEDEAHVPVTPEHVADMTSYIGGVRSEPIEVIAEGPTDPHDADDRRRHNEWELAGATWWLETMWDALDDADRVTARITAGPTVPA
ncbi:MAG: LLM class flavin-dependent oxidoreductase [Acidimicrobiia bacterium]|nr:LLM class flavin-dependent oxidoreductase [Acidimicrobiia bacterium]